jgi:hypothetical protein
MPHNYDWALLLDRFVASFNRFDDLSVFEGWGQNSAQLAVGEPDEWGRRHWRPAKVRSEPALLEPIYSKLPARFPPLFEHFVLSYRWAEVELRSCRLLANPPGISLEGLLKEMSRDAAIWGALLPAGYIQFGKGPDIDYDPVCFDITSRNKDREYRIVKIDHEEILCNDRVKVVSQLAPSFESFLLETIERANEV